MVKHSDIASLTLGCFIVIPDIILFSLVVHESGTYPKPYIYSCEFLLEHVRNGMEVYLLLDLLSA